MRNDLATILLGPITVPHPSYEEPTPAEKEEVLGEEPSEDINVFIHTYSHEKLGGDRNDAFTEHSWRTQPHEDIIEEIDYDEFTGDTPLEKAHSYSEWLKHLEKERREAEEGEGDPDARKKLKDAAKKGMTALREFQRLKKENEFAYGELAGNVSPEAAVLKPRDKKVLEALSKISKLPTISLGKSKKLVPDPGGKIIRTEVFEDFSDLPLVDHEDLNSPLFIKEALDGDILIQKQYSHKDLKQIIFLLIDRSGSMYSHVKQSYVKAVLLHLFEQVRKGDATVYVSSFEVGVDFYAKIDSEEVARKFLRAFNSIGGGGTDIQSCVEHTQRCILNGKLERHEVPSWFSWFDDQAEEIKKDLVRAIGKDHIDPISLQNVASPEVLVVNDGEDPIDPGWVPAYPLHTIILGEQNMPLRAACLASKGTYNELILYEY